MTNKLVFSHAGNFTAKFGGGARPTLEARFIQLKAFDAKRGINTSWVFVDDAASVAAFGVPPATAATATAIKAVVDAIAAKTPMDYFLIVGGHDIVPMFEYTNPVSGTSDKVVPSDNGYASSRTGTEKPLIPDRCLGRLPTGNDATPEVLWKQFDEILLFKQAAPATVTGYALYADYWSKPSQDIAQQLGIGTGSQSVSPPVDVVGNGSSFPSSGLAGARLHYINLHGAQRNPPWYGQDGKKLSSYPEACLPPLIPTGVRNSVVACEACYGGDAYGTKGVRRLVSTANCLTYLEQQAIGFCGSTTIAYGGTNDAPDLWAADLLVLYFLEEVQGGKEMGAALLDAKVKVAQQAMQKNNAYDELTQKTLLQFVLYGDPSVAPLATPPGAKFAKEFGGVQSLRELIPSFNEALPSVSVTVLPVVTLPVIEERTGSKQVRRPMPPLPGNMANAPARLLHREEREMTWSLPAGLRAMSALREKSVISKEVAPENLTQVWTSETYEIGMVRGEQEQYFVRVLEDRGKEFRIVAQGVSR